VHRHAIDSLFTDDHSVEVPPWLLHREGDPVAAELIDVLEADPSALDGLPDHTPETVGRRLGVADELVERFPVALFEYAMGLALEVTGVPESSPAERQMIRQILAYWDVVHEVAGRRRLRYRVSPAGLERDFEGWLIEHLDVLGDVGYPVVLGSGTVRDRRGQQWRTPIGRRPDLVCRITETKDDVRRGDWLVIENKAYEAGEEAVEQLADYVEAVKEHLAAPGSAQSGCSWPTASPSRARTVSSPRSSATSPCLPSATGTTSSSAAASRARRRTGRNRRRASRVRHAARAQRWPRAAR
jgi:hypothetical protein